jgi:hypothetical protein
VLGEDGNVLAPLAQWWQMHGEHAQAVVQVAAETTALDVGVEVAVRRGDDADVHRAWLVVADPADLILIEHAQEAGLQLDRAFPDFVEK